MNQQISSFFKNNRVVIGSVSGVLILILLFLYTFLFGVCRGSGCPPMTIESYQPAEGIQVELGMPVQRFGRTLTSKQVDFSYDPEKVKVPDGYGFIRALIDLKVTNNQGNLVSSFDPPLQLVVSFTIDEMSSLEAGSSLVLLIYDSNLNEWVPQDTLIMNNDCGGGVGVVLIRHWTSGVGWGCRGACKPKHELP